MIFWNEKKLAVRLRDRMLSPKEQFAYTIAYSLITAIFVSKVFLIITSSSLILQTSDYISDTLSIALAVLIPVCAYKANIQGDNKNFMMRFFSLSVPITIKMFVLAVLLASSLGVLTYYMKLSDHEMRLGSWIISITVDLITLWLYHSVFTIASGQTARETVNV
jgi:hypothetical protein